MQIDFGNRYADVYKVNEKGSYFVKVSFPEVGFYVKRVVVHPDKEESKKMLVKKPKICVGFNNWQTNYEFSNSSELWKLIEEEALKAVDVYNVSHHFDDIETLDIDKALGEAIDKLSS